MPFPAQLAAYRKQWGYAPKILLIDGVGVVAVEDTKRSAETCLDVFEDLMKVSFLADSFGGPRFLAPKDIQFIETWEVESYRAAVARQGRRREAAGGREDRLVTGRGAGVWKGNRGRPLREGANVVIADLNEAAGRALQDELNAAAAAAGTPNRAVFVACRCHQPRLPAGACPGMREGIRRPGHPGEQRRRAESGESRGDDPGDLRLSSPV